MRIRALKPGFFKNEELCSLSPWHRLCFEGLWLCADRDGRLEDRPKRLKAEVFPYDDLDMDNLLWDLAHAGFIMRYEIDRRPLISLPTWGDHQHPRPDEAQSILPPYAPGTQRVNGLDHTTYPAVMPQSLLRDEPVTSLRSGIGSLEVGNGILEVGNGERAIDTALHPPRAQNLIDLWNATTKPPLPRCRELTDERRRKIRARLAARPFAEWREVFEAVQASAFYRGENDRQWTADFDYVIRNDTIAAKVLERHRVKQERPSRQVWTCVHTPHCRHRAECEIVAMRKT